MRRFVQLGILILSAISFSCEKTSPSTDFRPNENPSQEGVSEKPQDLGDVTLEEITKNPGRVTFYGNRDSPREDVQAILKNNGFFEKELTNKDGKYLLQLAEFDGSTGPQNVAILSKESNEKFVPTMVVPIKVKSVPSLYEKDDKLLINFKQETDWGAEIKIENDKLEFIGFEE